MHFLEMQVVITTIGISWKCSSSQIFLLRE
jgi:hypothetical protein